MKHLLVFLGLAAVCASACGQSGWSGTAEFTVEPLNVNASDWDYIPQSVVYETDGKNWRIVERGTSFERVWIGQHTADRYHILFHFLGNAVELEATCEAGVVRSTTWGIPPCPWADAATEDRVVITDGPVQYALERSSSTAAKPTWWDRGHFDIPPGYEPIDKPGLAALLHTISSPSD